MGVSCTLSQISMAIFKRVCRTFVFPGLLFLVSCLFVYLFVYKQSAEKRVKVVCSNFE